jgi:hypothetical protein
MEKTAKTVRPFHHRRDTESEGVIISHSTRNRQLAVCSSKSAPAYSTKMVFGPYLTKEVAGAGARLFMIDALSVAASYLSRRRRAGPATRESLKSA